MEYWLLALLTNGALTTFYPPSGNAASVDWTAVGTILLAVATMVLVGVTWRYVNLTAGITKASQRSVELNQSLLEVSRESLELNREELRELQAREKNDRHNHRQTALGLLSFFQDDLEQMTRVMSSAGIEIAVRWEPDDFALLLNSAHESLHFPAVAVHRIVVNLRWFHNAAVVNRASAKPLIMFGSEEWTRRHENAMATLIVLTSKEDQVLVTQNAGAEA